MTRPDRFPPLPPEQLTADQQAAVDELVASPRGGVIGPFIATLRSPELTRRLQRLGEYIRFEAALPEKLREMAILLTAREWTQGFEWERSEERRVGKECRCRGLRYPDRTRTKGKAGQHKP